MKNRFIATFLLFLLLAAEPLLTAMADSIQLVNGDNLNGKVISLNEKEVKLKSDVLGEISIQREKVVAITFGDRRPEPVRRPVPESERTDGRDTTADAVLKELKANGIDPSKVGDVLDNVGVTQPPRLSSGGGNAKSDKSAGDVIKQLQSKGVDKEMIDELKVKLPLLNLPGVGTYFDKTLSGLSSGNLDLTHLRKDAVKARDGLIDLKKDLGPSGVALDGYLRILNKFIDETEPPAKDPADETNQKNDPRRNRGKT